MSSGVYERSGVKLHYRVSGEGPPMVLVHGLSGSGRWWRRNLPALTQHHRVYSLDLSGYGAARRQRALSVRESAALIASWLEAEDLHNITLIGHSMGGHICIRVAAGYPQRIQNLVLVCASGLLKASAYRTALNLPRALITGRKRFVPRILTDALLAGPLNLWRSASDLLKDSVLDCLPQITARTLVVWGERDALVPLPLGKLLAESIPGAHLTVIPHAGHVVMVDAPEPFNAAVLNFVDGPQASG
ncbi:alpha/beta fold hydrolase [Deinococcus arenicola]|uniref:Alpha/beta hydrolase n=1 Tax=Deinococcus arenicola TaxID=2994950 RepID=A0ABU4DNU9_9DEIO|nr:alpha/beta hydrolase [Deinococcus sp. ZS9-10]MDV6374038.1 alpha/beta hydrolase [Deinococcus sp. ZS9-10]